MTQPIFDRQDQLDKIASALIPNEVIEAVFDLKGSGTGFIGITNKRIVVYDKAFLRRMKAMVSIPYSRIHSIATQDESGLLTGRGFFASSTLAICTSHGDYDFEFRGADKAHIAHSLILGHMV